jgi:hypothetical protein
MPITTATASRSTCFLIFAGLSAAKTAFESTIARETVIIFVSLFPLMSVATIVNFVSCPARATFLMR